MPERALSLELICASGPERNLLAMLAWFCFVCAPVFFPDVSSCTLVLSKRQVRIDRDSDVTRLDIRAPSKLSDAIRPTRLPEYRLAAA
jgi:hypothetical protein